MVCCLNPNCENPQNPDGANFCLSCGTELVSLLRNRYRIISPLGRGGFARTYIAEDIDKLNERCVVKQLVLSQFYGSQGSQAHKKATELFEREAKRLKELGEHLQIPNLYAYFKEAEYLYLVQQFIEGQNLLQELKQQGVFDEAKIRDFLKDLLSVLVDIHQQQVIHRDLKPENIIRRQNDGKLVLIDFGVAKQKTEPTNTAVGTIIGSLGYAPIEQMQAGKVFPSSDIYSLGITCFHLLTNISPSSLWMKQGYGWTSNWRQHLTQPISQELEMILNKSLQENHEQRYQSAQTLLQDLKKLPPLRYTSVPTVIPPTMRSRSQPHQHQSTRYLPQFSNSKLLSGAIIAGSGSSFLAIALISFLGTTWISSGLWLLILGGLVSIQSRPLLEKAYLIVIAIIANLLVVFTFRNLLTNNLLKAGLNGLLLVGLLVILAGLFTVIIVGVSEIINKLIAKYL
ncbi:serine/threonine-protein kinase [Nostoc sp. 'Peltigera malacea cyanobiont' DB3992]|uniref:serine/threonine-protein kinase n=1 Tax=Nostoc sp. 'Peltigera malacea cyanobiont' DB3992 TaxID=1206980 RepID=UPI000C050DCD|nr:serine/threonine-protein kinase [Nostoc sp. 'Peltigera malacea cyanobiont' DB3992]PHM10066.1 serine/threonine protein kinase [Nostoc sp. 'Peltigera malacea cyanobiont' DB3992]